MRDDFKVKGRVMAWLNGGLVLEKDNLVVTAGKSLIASRLIGNTPAAITHMALGSGTTATAPGQTALVTQLGRVAVTSTSPSVVAIITGVFGAGIATGTINEAGLFNAATGGTMISRVLMGGIPKTGASDVLEVVWELEVQ